MLRRLHQDQPASFAFTPENRAWAEAQIAKYPEGRQASAIIALLWRAQEQEGWLTRPAIEYVAEMLDMAYIRALEVATFYFMFQLQPVGSVAHFQVCGTTPCMLCGSDDLVRVCREKIAKQPHTLSADGKFSWEEVECLGACANAPMAQIGKDYYEDLDADSFARLIDAMAAGEVPTPGSQKGRFASEPLGGATALTGYTGQTRNASLELAAQQGDTLKRIDGSEVALTAPWRDHPRADGMPMAGGGPVPDTAEAAPRLLDAAQGAPDDLKQLKGVGPKLEATLNALGVWHFWQIADWTDAEVAWIDARLQFKGRIARDGWIAQARALADTTQGA